MKRLSYIGFKGLILLFSILPFSLLYLLADFLFFILYWLVQYRYKLVITQLKSAFPSYQEDEIKQIAKDSYRNLADIILESVKGFTLSKATLMKRYKFINIAILDSAFENNQSVIIVGGHYGNWEWGVIGVPLWLKHFVLGVYKPLSNKYIDNYFNQLRQRWGLGLTPMAKTVRAMVQNRDRTCAYVFIADQTPSDTQNAHWINFFNQETPFIHGFEKIARRTNFPVYYYTIKRIKRGYYTNSFELLEASPASLSEGELTEKFARKMEQMIQEDPAPWLWTHRRWKWKRGS